MANSGHPLPPVLARNLLSNDRCRAALGDEAVKSGPEVSCVESSLSLSSDRKRLTWRRSGPDPAIFRPVRVSERPGPGSDAGEEMALAISGEIVSPNIDN